MKNFFQQNYTKLRNLFLSMTLRNKIAASLHMAMFLTLLGYLAVSGITQADQRSMNEKGTDFAPWSNSRIIEAKMLAAKERDCAEALKMIIGIADAKVITKNCPAWDRNVWLRRQNFSASVVVEAVDNKPLNPETIGVVGTFVAAVFGITDMKDINILDAKVSRTYDGSGKELRPNADQKQQKFTVEHGRPTPLVTHELDYHFHREG